MKPEGLICLPVISVFAALRRQGLTESISERMRMDMHISIIVIIMVVRFMFRALLSFRLDVA